MAFENFLRNAPQKTTHESTTAFGGSTSGVDGNGSPKPGGSRDLVSEAADAVEQRGKPARSGPKVGRNDPCPCRSGKKYKHCCGK